MFDRLKYLAEQEGSGGSAGGGLSEAARLARFYSDMTPPAKSTQASPSRPTTDPRAQAAPPPGKSQLTPAERRARFFDDPDVARLEAQRRRSEEVEAARTARRRAFYGPDAPSSKPSERPAAGKPDGSASPAPAGEAKPAAAALELEAPEGFDSGSPGWQEFVKTASELRLDSKGAERLLAMHQAEQARLKDASMDAWEAATRADREIGGDRLDATITDAREALDRHGTPELRELLDETGLGSHPEVIRLLARVARTTRSRGW